ncbi:DUF86 domain-containing protein [Magnetospirillum sp. UT-4]|uniref:HepT-like ribonuclease domain-containing protein n=1 Tax=Magnetospirillum sp. UT-4 TaxID=2681467 RepID=UPI00137D05BE|nr:HepT-like ribonuclease domain-containing protein [Magnetospirillum sp. UT-4]CAA7613387.1 conserved hypothetical protein [Magnetospirillum sp. UT-4]
MRPDDLVRLRHIADPLNAVVRFASGRCREDLDGDEMLTFALLHAIQVVGEAAAKISPEARADHPDVPWAAIIGMRNRLVHAYFDVDHDILWTTVADAAPRLLAQVTELLIGAERRDPS